MFPLFILLLLVFCSFIFQLLSFSGLIAFSLLGSFLIFFTPFPFWGMFTFLFLGSAVVKKIQEIHQLSKNPYEEKNNQRDFEQVLANSLPTLFFLVMALKDPQPVAFYVGAASSLATAFSDTMASEIGGFSNGATYTLLGKKIPKGRSGGVSILGTFSGFLASFAMSSCFLILTLLTSSTISPLWFQQFISIGFLGFFGMLLDSFLGLFQGVYLTSYQTLSEKKTPHKVYGTSLLNNDGVNFLSQLLTGLLAWFLFS